MDDAQLEERRFSIYGEIEMTYTLLDGEFILDGSDAAPFLVLWDELKRTTDRERIKALKATMQSLAQARVMKDLKDDLGDPYTLGYSFWLNFEVNEGNDVETERDIAPDPNQTAMAFPT